MATKPKGTAKPLKVSNPSLKMIEFTGASIADAVAATGASKSGKLYMIPVDKIHVVPGFNLRLTDTPEYAAGIDDLKNSILLEGFYDSKPLSVFAAEAGGQSVAALIDGHRRYAAVQAAIADGADISKLPVVFMDAKSTDVDLAVALQKQNASAALTMLERAVLAYRMMKAGETEEAVAERLNVTVRHVNDLKILIGAPKAVRDLIKSGKLSATEAVTQLRKEGGAEKILEAAAKAEERAADKANRQDQRLTRSTIEDTSPPDAPKVKMVTHRANFQVAAGATFEYEDAAPYIPLIGDETWFKKARKQTQRIALEDVSIEVKVRRPKQEEAEAEGETATETEAAADPAPKAGRKGGRPRNVPEPDGGLDDDFDAAPNLKDMGIAEPADAGL